MIYSTLHRVLPRTAAIVLTTLIYIACLLAVIVEIPVVSSSFRYMAR